MKVKVKKAKRIPAPVEQEKSKMHQANNNFISIDLKTMCYKITANHQEK